MSDDRSALTQSPTGPAVTPASGPDVVYVERERIQDTSRHDTTVIRDTGAGSGMGILPWLLGLLVLGGLLFLLLGGPSKKDGLDVKVDVAAPKMPEINLPDVNVNVDVPDLKAPELPKSDKAAADEPKPQE